MLINFHNSFTDWLVSNSDIKLTLNIASQFTYVIFHLVKYESSTNCRTQGLSKSNCHVRFSYSKSLLMIPLFNSTIKILLAAMLKITHHWLYATATTKKEMPRQNVAVNQSLTMSICHLVSQNGLQRLRICWHKS